MERGKSDSGIDFANYYNWKSVDKTIAPSGDSHHTSNSVGFLLLSILSLTA